MVIQCLLRMEQAVEGIVELAGCIKDEDARGKYCLWGHNEIVRFVCLA